MSLRGAPHSGATWQSHQYSMHHLLIRAKNNKVISGSFIIVSGGLLGSLTNYLYHLFMARSLDPKDYGILESMISLIYQLGIPLTSISLVITRYVSYYKGQNKIEKIESFFWKLFIKALIIIPLLAIILILTIPFISSFLYIPKKELIFWIIIAFCLGIVGTLTKSFMQGLARFFSLSISGFSDGLFRLLTALLFLSFGWGLFGAIFSFFAAGMFSLLISIFLVRDLFIGNKTTSISEKKEIFNFFFPVLFTNLGITSFITSDVILVRHFFPPHDAGLYSALSTLSKIIFFAASPVLTVIYPLISESEGAKKNARKEILSAFIIIALIISGVLFIFKVFPREMVFILFGEKYISMVPFVFNFAVAMSIYTINFTLANIFLALKQTKPAYFILVGALCQIILIFFFHDSLIQIINIFIIISALLLITLLLYYWYVRKKITFHNRPNI